MVFWCRLVSEGSRARGGLDPRNKRTRCLAPAGHGREAGGPSLRSQCTAYRLASRIRQATCRLGRQPVLALPLQAVPPIDQTVAVTGPMAGTVQAGGMPAGLKGLASAPLSLCHGPAACQLAQRRCGCPRWLAAVLHRWAVYFVSSSDQSHLFAFAWCRAGLRSHVLLDGQHRALSGQADAAARHPAGSASPRWQSAACRQARGRVLEGEEARRQTGWAVAVCAPGAQKDCVLDISSLVGCGPSDPFIQARRGTLHTRAAMHAHHAP